MRTLRTFGRRPRSLLLPLAARCLHLRTPFPLFCLLLFLLGEWDPKTCALFIFRFMLDWVESWALKENVVPSWSGHLVVFWGISETPHFKDRPIWGSEQRQYKRANSKLVELSRFISPRLADIIQQIRPLVSLAQRATAYVTVLGF